MKTTTYTVTQTPVLIVPAIQFEARTVYLDPLANDIVVGGSDVTDTTGVKLTKSVILSMIIPPNESLYAVTKTGSHPITVLEPTT